MTLDDVMEVWRSQDVSPLHGVNEAVIRLALRQDEARMQRARRRLRRWFTYVIAALMVEGMARKFFIVINRDGGVLSGLGLCSFRSLAWPPYCSGSA